jgi:hypothetical protein
LKLDNANIKIAPFSEYVAVTTSQSVNPLFDIIIDENVILENYCKILLNKVFELPQSKFQAFINYQTDIIQDELKWCYHKEGVNHYENCKGIADQVLKKLKSPYWGSEKSPAREY